ncbi:MAG: hypothetical protein J2P50_18490, partial [Hyphomicrobiaceae bacterium]|nr:hypothetical protein [Hyphomicrobiaceae bacterium]
QARVRSPAAIGQTKPMQPRRSSPLRPRLSLRVRPSAVPLGPQDLGHNAPRVDAKDPDHSAASA